MHYKNKLSMLVSLSLLSVNCGKSTSSSSDAGTVAAGTAGTATVSSDVSSLQDLSLTGILKISLPDSVKGSGTASSLKLTGTKSFEACKLRQEMREGLSNIAQVASTFCFLESDPSLKFGKKYNIDFSSMMPDDGAGETPTGGAPTTGAPTTDGATPPDGFDPGAAPTGLRLANGMPESVQIWIDNSTANKLIVYMCQDKKLSQMIEVTGAKKGEAKGSLIMKQEMSFGDFSFKFHRTMAFDSNYTEAGRTLLTLKELIDTSSTKFGSEKARRLLSLSLADKGVSKVLSSFSGKMEGSEVAFASVGAFDTDFGEVIAKGSFSDPEGGDPFEFSGESFFDGKSFVVDPEAHPTAFGTDGKVKIEASSVPGYLSESFSPDDFPAGAWDCTGTTDLTLDTTSASSSGASSCSESWAELSEEDCDAGDFAEGKDVTINESEQVPPEDISTDEVSPDEFSLRKTK